MCVTSCESIFFLFCRGWLGYFFLFGSINRREVEKKKSPLDMGTLRSILNSFDSIDPAMFLSYLAEDLTCRTFLLSSLSIYCKIVLDTKILYY